MSKEFFIISKEWHQVTDFKTNESYALGPSYSLENSVLFFLYMYEKGKRDKRNYLASWLEKEADKVEVSIPLQFFYERNKE